MDWRKFLPRVDMVAELNWKSFRISLGAHSEDRQCAASVYFEPGVGHSYMPPAAAPFYGKPPYSYN